MLIPMPRKATKPPARLLLGVFAASLSVASLYGAFWGYVVIGFSRTTLGLVVGAAFLLASVAVFALCVVGARKSQVREVMIAFALSLALLVSYSAMVEVW
jgi:hypothetical protein